jgi:hypothetical protein
MKTKERLVKQRLADLGIKFSIIAERPFFCNEVTIEVPTQMNVSFMVEGELPIMEFDDDMGVTDVLSGRISRVIAIEDAKKRVASTVAQNNFLRARADDAAGEFSEFLNHIRNPRVQVK